MTQTFSPGAPNWVDLGTTDVSAAAAFYGGLFGWTHQDFGPDMGNYGMFAKDGKLVGGVSPTMSAAQPVAWTTYFATADADATARSVEEAGGSVEFAPMDVMEQGRMAAFVDPTGARFSVWQPNQHTGAELVRAPGAMAWNELYTSDVEAAKRFYAAALPVDIRDVDMGGGMVYTLLTVGGNSVAGAMTVPGVPPGWNVYFDVEDCDATYAAALAAGGTSIEAPMDSPPGRFAFLRDPQGAPFAIIKSNPDFQV